MSGNQSMQQILRVHGETLGRSGKPASRQLLIDAADSIDAREELIKQLVFALKAVQRNGSRGDTDDGHSVMSYVNAALDQAKEVMQ